MFIIFYNPIVGSIFLFLKEKYLNISTLENKKEIIPLEFRSIKFKTKMENILTHKKKFYTGKN